MDARTGYTDSMTEREPAGGVLVRVVASMRVSREEQRRHGYSFDDRERVTEHPFVQVFRTGEGWNWCYVHEVVVEKAS